MTTPTPSSLAGSAPDGAPGPHGAAERHRGLTVVYVAYGVDRLQLDWIPAGTPVIVVCNDDRLTPPERPGLVVIDPGTNLGFGAAVNRALDRVDTPRILLCNPDTDLDREHFDALATSPTGELVALPLVEMDGTANSVINGYWGPVAFVATALRLGRFAPRDGLVRRLLTPLLGRWGRAHRASLDNEAGTWPLAERWATAAVLALPVAEVRAVGGFDDAYFLYYEDADLQQRLAARFPHLRLRLLDSTPGVHEVGGSATGERSAVARHRRAAAVVYARRQPGVRWRLAALAVAAADRRWR
ncbi:MAG: hypothetical protein AAF962_12830 [Actinomycetota bacterium]